MIADIRGSSGFRNWLRKREAERQFLISHGFDAHSPVMEILRDFLTRPSDEQQQLFAAWAEWETHEIENDADEIVVSDLPEQ